MRISLGGVCRGERCILRGEVGENIIGNIDKGEGEGAEGKYCIWHYNMLSRKEK